jgi:protein TonB
MAYAVAVSFAAHGAVALAFMPFELTRAPAAAKAAAPVAVKLRAAPPSAAALAAGLAAVAQESPAAGSRRAPASDASPAPPSPAPDPAPKPAAEPAPGDGTQVPPQPNGPQATAAPGLIPAAVYQASPDPAVIAAAELKAAVGRALRYPDAARRRGAAGRVAVELYLDPDGELRRAPRAIGSSGSALLDRAALDAAAAAAGSYTPPGRPIAVRIVIVFEAGAAAALP